MRISAIHTYEFGALGTQSFDFKDDWSGDTADRILFSGPNGCGKSTLLRGIAMIWEAFGHWLQHRKPLENISAISGGFAIVLENMPYNLPNLIIYSEQLPKSLYIDYDNITWKTDFIKKYKSHSLSITQGRLIDDKASPISAQNWFTPWSVARQKMLLSPEPSTSPNILFLDAEERRWVAPQKDIGEIRPENLQQRWLSSYKATTNWDGQVESALLNMKVSSEARFDHLVDDMNQFLSGKQILKEVILGENRLRVELDNGTTHSIDELSAGEHQVLIQLYMVDRWLENGGIALIDEPDLYLHPSLIGGFMAQLERMVSERDGQLIITSHIPEVWERYETLGKRVVLGNGDSA